jgi:RimJ/RimL family protein N-acetyltransferase
VKLLDVHTVSRADSLWRLWDLLSEREPQDNISHEMMPAWSEHIAFVDSRPYKAWYFIVVDEIVGTIYLSRFKEISWSIFKRYRSYDYAAEAVELLMKAHPCPFYLANVNPPNEPKIATLKKLGFDLAFVQATYRLTPKNYVNPEGFNPNGSLKLTLKNK